MNIHIYLSPSLYLSLEAVKPLQHAISQYLPSIHSSPGGRYSEHFEMTQRKCITDVLKDQGFIMVLKTSIAFLTFVLPALLVDSWRMLIILDHL